MNIGRFGMGIRYHKTKDFKFFYCPLGKGIGREKFHFFWWFRHKWYIALGKRSIMTSLKEEER